LKNNDTIHLVKQLQENTDEGGDGPAVKIATSKPNEANLITVIVPENVSAGTRLMIDPPGRERMQVVVPAGLNPGDRFQVRLPAQNSTPQPNPQRQPSPAGGGGTIMQVVCPPNATAGQSILIDVPGQGRMRVQVPAGVGPGQQFRFRVAN